MPTPYSDIRPRIRDGDLFFCQGTEPDSQLIRRYEAAETGVPFEELPSHVGMAIWDHSRLCIFEAMDEGQGVRLLPFSVAVKEYSQRHGRVWWSKLHDGALSRNALVMYALNMWGQPYCTRIEELAVAVPALRPLAWGPDSANRYTCSRMITCAFVRAGYVWLKDPWLTLPIDIQGFTCLDPRVEIDLTTL